MTSKTFSLIIFCLFGFSINSIAQERHHACADAKQKMAARLIAQQARPAAAAAAQISHELKYDVKFVHLNLFLERNTKYVKGGVTTVAKVTSAVLDTFQTLLHINHAIDSIRFNGALVTALRQDSMVKVKPPVPVPNGANFTVTIYYKGTPPAGGSANGSGFDTDIDPQYNNEVTWSLSESFVAYTWWPCKQILTDKIDSSWVFVTTDSTNKVGSNGRLKNVVALGNKKRYEWKSRNPIDYYLISVAVAKYKEYNLYAKPQYLPNDSILIQNYIYDNAINNAAWIGYDKIALDQMPQTLNFLSNMYGMYPFYKEKYGHCMAYFSGAMEHQTMTSTFGFDFYIDAHELGHQWWGDNVTCKSWGDIWINEGFADYTELLVAQYLDPTNFASRLTGDHNYVMGQAGGSIHFTNQDTMNTTRIFDYRLTYVKGGAIIHTLRFLTNNDSLWFNTLRGFQATYKNSNASVVDFKNYYQAQTGINATQFFYQWYYSQGYPIFDVRYNFGNGVFYLKSSQAVSMPNVSPLFITPMEYKIARVAKPDTIIRVMHNVAIENYSFALSGTVTGVVCDPNNWVINKVTGPGRDFTLGIDASTSLPKVEQAFAEISIGPNPANDNLKVLNPAGAGGLVYLYDLSGRLLMKQTLKTETIFDVSQLSKGIYLLKVCDVEGVERLEQKIIKE